MQQTTRWVLLAVLGCTVATEVFSAVQQEGALQSKKVIVRDGVELCYIEHGVGVPLIFIHGGLEDFSLWQDQVRAFGKNYRTIAYSRRYNFPNSNNVRPNHSAAVDAEDLAAMIQKLKLGKCHIVGFSYGGTSALFLALRHPELVRTLTLAEPALIPWLTGLSAPRVKKGKAVYADYHKRLVTPAKEKFEKRDPEGALRVTLDYLSGKGMYDRSPEHHDLWMRNAKELEAIFTSKAGLSAPSPDKVRGLKTPTLLLSGEKSADSCRLVVAELETLLSTKRKELPDATHAMWIDKPQDCRKIVLEFLRGR